VTGICVNSLPDSENLSNAFEISGVFLIDYPRLYNVSVTKKSYNFKSFFVLFLGPMIEPKIVSCLTKTLKDTWMTNINDILKSTRFPSVSISQVYQTCSAYASPPYVQLVAYLRMLYESGKIRIKDEPYPLHAQTPCNNSPVVPTPQIVVSNNTQSIDICHEIAQKSYKSHSLDKCNIRMPKSLTVSTFLENIVHPKHLSFHSKSESVSSNLSHLKLRSSLNYCSFNNIATRRGNPLYKSRENLLEDLSSSVKQLQAERLKNPANTDIDILHAAKNCISYISTAEDDCNIVNPVCRTKSLPVIKLAEYISKIQEPVVCSPINTRRKRLVRQDAFDYGDQDETVVENILDLNDNLNLTMVTNILQETQTLSQAQSSCSYGSFDSGVDDHTVSTFSNSA